VCRRVADRLRVAALSLEPRHRMCQQSAAVLARCPTVSKTTPWHATAQRRLLSMSNALKRGGTCNPTRGFVNSVPLGLSLRQPGTQETIPARFIPRSCACLRGAALLTRSRLPAPQTTSALRVSSQRRFACASLRHSLRNQPHHRVRRRVAARLRVAPLSFEPRHPRTCRHSECCRASASLRRV